MNRAARIAEREEKANPMGRTIDIFSVAEIRWAFEEEALSSERRWEKIQSPKSVAACRKACAALITREQLVVSVTKKPAKVPEIDRGFRFKYSRPEGYGSLGETVGRMRKGEKITVAWVEEEGNLVGYGFAVGKPDAVEIEIIDVDVDSRRSSGLCGAFKVARQTFNVGIGHLVVAALIDECAGTIRVDATTHGSRYIFKSLGFTREKGTSNPCLLSLER